MAAAAVAKGTVEAAKLEARFLKNEVFGNAKAGLHLRGGACPHVEGNVFRNGKAAGGLISEGACGWIVDNVFRGHEKTELQVCDASSCPVLDGNTMADSKAGGI